MKRNQATGTVTRGGGSDRVDGLIRLGQGTIILNYVTGVVNGDGGNDDAGDLDDEFFPNFNRPVVKSLFEKANAFV